MSRIFKLLVVAVFATTIMGCGDKKGDDASSEVSSNDSGGSSDGEYPGANGYSDSNDNAGSDGDYPGANGYPDSSEPPGSDEAYPGANGYPDSSEPPGSDEAYPGANGYPDSSEPPGSDEVYPGANGYPDSSEPPGSDEVYPGANGYPDSSEPPGSDEVYPGANGYPDSSEPPGSDEVYPGANGYPDSSEPPGSDGYPGGPNGPNSVQRTPKTYSDHARVAFEQGHDDLALQYAYAAILTDADVAKNQKLHYWAGPRKPTMAIRWGIGINYVAPKNLTSRPPMIGDKPNLPEGDTRGTGRSRVIGRRNRDENNGDPGFSGDDSGTDYGGDGTGAGDGSGGGKFRLPSDSWGQLLYLTGDVGERFIERLDMRRVRGYYGDVLKVAPPVQRRRNSGDDGGAVDYSDGAVDYSGGSADYSVDSGTEGYGDGGRSSGRGGPQLIPGVTMLGLGNSKELLSRAEQQGLDVLLVFEVAYSKTLRSNIERNETGMRLFSVADGKELRKANPLNNLAVWNARENLKDDKNDPVDLAIDSILSSFADEHVRVMDLPNLNAEKAKFRVTSLTENKVADPLPVLVEIKYYHTQHWLTDSELADAFKQVMGDVGLQLAAGSFEDQKKALATYLGVDAEPSLTPSGPRTGGFR